MARSLIRIERKWGKYWVCEWKHKGPGLSLVWYSGPHGHRETAEKVMQSRLRAKETVDHEHHH